MIEIDAGLESFRAEPKDRIVTLEIIEKLAVEMQLNDTMDSSSKLDIDEA